MGFRRLEVLQQLARRRFEIFIVVLRVENDGPARREGRSMVAAELVGLEIKASEHRGHS
jgi:hypothetical protein